MKAKLKCDVVSVAWVTVEIPDKKSRTGYRKERGPRIYGKKNDEVEIINSNGNVWIVENEKKDRYAVKESDLIIQS